MSIEIVTSAVIENKKGQILIVQQKKWNNFWTFPGGHVEEGENIITAAIREGTEETGLKLQPLEMYCFGEEINPINFEKKIHVIFFHLHCKALTNNLVLESEEIQDAKWIDLDEINDYQIPPGFKKSLELLKQYKEGKISIPQFLSIK